MLAIETKVIDIEKKKIKTIGYSGVVGDLFHYGHLNSIQFAESLSDLNVCGVLTDKAVEEYRSRPISNLEERKAVISSLKCVDRVMIQETMDPTKNLEALHREFPYAEILLVHGSDWKEVPGLEFINEIGGKVIQHPYYKRLSTFKIIDKIISSHNNPKDIQYFSDYLKEPKEVDMAKESQFKTIVSTKANTLQTLQMLLKRSKIEKIYIFTVPDWNNKKSEILHTLRSEFSPNKIVVRSSAVNEDTLDNSMAGYFVSFIDVDSDNIDDTTSAIEKVIESYKQKNSESSFNQILIQSQSTDIMMSGVIFTRTLDNSPYYVINYDDSTGETDTVTKGVESKSIKILRSASAEDIPSKFKKLIIAAKEIEELIPKIGLDIEFAINKIGEIITFQVRPLTLSLVQNDIEDHQIRMKVDELKNTYQKRMKKEGHVCGDYTIFADMPDWNPAEIIGNNPNHLAYSLYDNIITDSIWHKARTSQGYFDVGTSKLVVLFGNKPYIDVRATFNSFIPTTIPDLLHHKLMKFYLEKLKAHPELHDKVEFEILFTCYDFCLDERLKELQEWGFSDEELSILQDSLVMLTNTLVQGFERSITFDLDQLKSLEENRIKALDQVSSPDIDINILLQNSKFLLHDCKEKGTLQFSRLARLAFIGNILMKSLVKKGIITSSVYDDFMRSVITVAKDYGNDLLMLQNEKISKDTFFDKYYHLRPGTYDITSPRYDSCHDLIGTSKINHENNIHSFSLDPKVKDEISEALQIAGLEFDADTLFTFTRKALEAREFSKFEFTKNLSDSLELIARAGNIMGFNREELAYLSVEDLFSEEMNNKDVLANKWKNTIILRSEEKQINDKLVLPSILLSENDFVIVKAYVPRPNFITKQVINGTLVNITDVTMEKGLDLEGKIVMIENADPGYDWIFTCDISGLITKYGGMASHMAIRCAEFGIPAAIGCGVIFDNLKENNPITLDCQSKKIIPMRG